jgi:hypothetical protein
MLMSASPADVGFAWVVAAAMVVMEAAVERSEARGGRQSIGQFRSTDTAVVEVLKQHADGGIEIGKTEEAHMAQSRQYPALDDQHRAFDLALVARFASRHRSPHQLERGHCPNGAPENRPSPLSGN